MQRPVATPIIAFSMALSACTSAWSQTNEPRPPKPNEIAPASAPAKTTISDATEPGDGLVVTGTITGEDGKPLSSASIYAYHTDANGHYDPDEPPDRQGPPRLKGYMRSDVNGHYEFRTIRPAPYPNSPIPAHVHYVISMAGYKDIFLEMLFSDDPRITDEYRAAVKEDRPYKFSICDASADANHTWRCKQDFVLRIK